MPGIRFKAKLFNIAESTIVLLPPPASHQLPSRGMVMVKGAIDDFLFTAALEPDGRGSHWFRVNKAMGQATGLRAGDTAALEIESIKDWPEPVIPADVKRALVSDPKANDLWQKITPMARWDWLRWIASTGRDETRKHHIEVAMSKMNHDMRRPCCFNRVLCTDYSVSKGGALLVPTVVT